MHQPSIVFSGFSINEPVTSITDLLISFLCIYFSLNLKKNKINLWAYFYFFLALTAFFGAFGHALFNYKNNLIMLFSRIMMIITTFCAAIACVTTLKNEQFRKYLNLFFTTLLVSSLYFISINNNFIINKWNTAIAFFIVIFISIYNSVQNKEGNLNIALGFILIILSGILQSLKFALSVWFNENDVAHFITIFGLLIIFKGILISNTKNETLVTA